MAWMNLEPAFVAARTALARRAPVDMARSGGCGWDQSGVFAVPFLGMTYLISYPEGILTADSPDLEPAAQVLLLHYLMGATDLLPSGRLISFKELPSGFPYAGPFAARAIAPLTRAFASDDGPDLLAAGAVLGGRPVELGDRAVQLPALPRVPLTMVVRFGDEEFPASGNILFDATAGVHLSTEDCVVLAETAVRRLRSAL